MYNKNNSDDDCNYGDAGMKGLMVLLSMGGMVMCVMGFVNFLYARFDWESACEAALDASCMPGTGLNASAICTPGSTGEGAGCTNGAKLTPTAIEGTIHARDYRGDVDGYVSLAGLGMIFLAIAICRCLCKSSRQTQQHSPQTISEYSLLVRERRGDSAQNNLPPTSPADSAAVSSPA